MILVPRVQGIEYLVGHASERVIHVIKEHTYQFSVSDDDQNGYGREREYGYKDDDRNSRGGDSYSCDGDGYGRDSDGVTRMMSNYNRRRRSQSNEDFQSGQRSRSSDRYRECGYDDDRCYSSRSSDARAEDHSQNER
ncbi:hypothetical protein MKX03_010406 [Papaver bracteatum]|nr:hypothetical protein MKX03_010406 [Papaver bracteatum]